LLVHLKADNEISVVVHSLQPSDMTKQRCNKYQDPQVQVQVPKLQVQVQVQVLRSQVQVPKLQVQVRVPGFYCKYR